jgi:hypothetical protein
MQEPTQDIFVPRYSMSGCRSRRYQKVANKTHGAKIKMKGDTKVGIWIIGLGIRQRSGASGESGRSLFSGAPADGSTKQ